MSGKRYYTLVEANAQLPELNALFVSVMQVRTQLKQLYRHLDDVGFAPSQENTDELPEDAPVEVQQDRARFFGMVEALREMIDQIHDTGCTIKDVEVGLVDWPAKNNGQEIELCWRFGESEIKFWHDLESGFAGRRPVSELLPDTADDHHSR